MHGMARERYSSYLAAELINGADELCAFRDLASLWRGADLCLRYAKWVGQCAIETVLSPLSLFLSLSLSLSLPSLSTSLSLSLSEG